jgi:hypothetical protein
MEIRGSKELDFNFDSNETSNEDEFNLLHASLGRCESKPRFTSCMASNCQAYNTSSGTLSINEKVLECFANKKCA